MKKTDIGKGQIYAQGGQEFKSQRVKTPFGILTVPGFVRVPPLSASKRTWRVWYARFVERPEQLEATRKQRVQNEVAAASLRKWKNKKRGQLTGIEKILFGK